MSARNSAIVRFSAVRSGGARHATDAVPPQLRSVFHLLDAVSPATAARLASHLWFRLPTPPPPERRSRHVPSGAREIRVRVPASGIVAVSEFGQVDGPVALLVHGWGGWWEQLAPYANSLAALGFRVIAFDAPSHGRSDAGRHGQRATRVMEMADAIRAVAEAVGPVRMVITHSIGAMALTWACRDGFTFGAGVLLAPAASVAPLVDRFQRLLGFGDRTRKHLLPLLERRIGYPLDDFDVPAAAGRITATSRITGSSSVPMLAIHDLADDETPASGSQDIVDAWPGSELMLTDGLGHRGVLWNPAVVRRVTDFAVHVRDDAISSVRRPEPLERQGVAHHD